ncbi:MAG: hypothetical protein ABI630_03190 [Betaproteobacteria bacterium]
MPTAVSGLDLQLRHRLGKEHCRLVEILHEVCERFMFVERGKISPYPDFGAAAADSRVAAYLGGGFAK